MYVNKPRVYNYEISEYIVQEVEIVPKQCWKNALLCFVSFHNKIFKENAFYVEGHVIPYFETMPDLLLPTDHGWCEIEKEEVIEIIDPTYAFIMSRSEVQKSQYFAGDRYTYDQTKKFWNSVLPRTLQRPRTNSYTAALEMAMKIAWKQLL